MAVPPDLGPRATPGGVRAGQRHPAGAGQRRRRRCSTRPRPCASWPATARWPASASSTGQRCGTRAHRGLLRTPVDHRTSASTSWRSTGGSSSTLRLRPKDDPYHRGQLARPLPARRPGRPGSLVETRRGTTRSDALSPSRPGCRSAQRPRRPGHADGQARLALRRGVGRSRSPSTTSATASWNCEGDATATHALDEAAAEAQVELVNAVQRASSLPEGALPLQMCPPVRGHR